MPETKKSNWVSFQEIKAKIKMETLLSHYKLLDGLKASGTHLYGCCPIHKGKNPRQFSVDLEKNIFNCFGDCGGGGNVIDFVAKMEGGIKIRQAALLIKKWYPQEFKEGEQRISADAEIKHEPVREKISIGESKEINPPLRFQLKNLDQDHPFLPDRGILPEAEGKYGLGYCSKGMMAGRIAIPIHNHAGELVAYCGRSITPAQMAEGKYKLPPAFIKTAVVYNLHRQNQGTKKLIVVESFFSVFALYQAGFANVVSFMGSTMGDEQKRLLCDFLEPDGQVMLLFDADESGQRGAMDCLTLLSSNLYVKILSLDQGIKKPHHLNIEAIKRLLSQA